MADRGSVAKQLLVGAPRASREHHRHLLPKRTALPVFSADPLSSVAYATEEMMLVLALAGASAFVLVQPLTGAVVLLFAIVVFSYRQSVRAYPNGGGAYSVARRNLGEAPALTAAGALLVEYVLTVAVSVAAGVAALTSAFPGLAGVRVHLAVGLVVLVTLANLRGAREAGILFAVPTYAFVATMLALVGVGALRCVGGCPPAPTAEAPVEPVAALTVFLVLRAFSAGAVALSGVEAISNGVQAFRHPQGRNAATTLAVMGALAITMFVGISLLASGTGVVATADMEQTVVAQIALAVLGQGTPFYVVQGVTAAILVLAANTAYADFPRLASVLATDRYLPRQLAARGDRLVFSNGILALAAAAAGLLIVFGADVTGLVQLYVVAVFAAFTLSQAGMVRHWLRERAPRWRAFAAVNGVGAVATGVVLVVTAVSGFTAGAWLALVVIPLVARGLFLVNRHYRHVRLALRAGVAEPEPVRSTHVVIVIDRVDEAAARAVSYARAIGPASVRAVAMPRPEADVEQRWDQLAPDVPLQVLDVDQSGPVGALRAALRERTANSPGATTTALIPETLAGSWVGQLRHHRLDLRVKSALLAEGRTVLANLTSPEGGPGPYTVEEPVEHHVIVLVSAVHRATLRALAYAENLNATSMRALSVNLELEGSGRMLDMWEDWGLRSPLELVDSPFRDLTESVLDYIDEFRPDGRQTMVTCVMPHFVVPRWYHRPLHNQSALLLRNMLLFERGVVTTTVPYIIGEDGGAVGGEDGAVGGEDGAT